MQNNTANGARWQQLTLNDAANLPLKTILNQHNACIEEISRIRNDLDQARREKDELQRQMRAMSSKLRDLENAAKDTSNNRKASQRVEIINLEDETEPASKQPKIPPSLVVKPQKKQLPTSSSGGLSNSASTTTAKQKKRKRSPSSGVPPGIRRAASPSKAPADTDGVLIFKRRTAPLPPKKLKDRRLDVMLRERRIVSDEEMLDKRDENPSTTSTSTAPAPQNSRSESAEDTVEVTRSKKRPRTSLNHSIHSDSDVSDAETIMSEGGPSRSPLISRVTLESPPNPRKRRKQETAPGSSLEASILIEASQRDIADEHDVLPTEQDAKELSSPPVRTTAQNAQNDEPGYKYKENLRFMTKVQRKELPAHECAECGEFLDAAEIHGEQRHHLMHLCGRHRSTWERENTPPGYWAMNMLLNTQGSIIGSKKQ